MLPIPSGQSHHSRDAWPFFIVVDASESMTWEDSEGVKPLDSACAGLDELLYGIEQDVEAAQNVWFEIITFADKARQHVALGKAEALPVVPEIEGGTWTNYVAAWKMVSTHVVNGCQRLVSEGYEVARPVIFFITDGNPGGVNTVQTKTDWMPYITEMNRVLGDKAPRIVALGVGRVNREVLLSLHSEDPHGAAAVAEPGYSTSSLITAALRQIKNSVVNSTTRGQFIWETPEGLENLCRVVRH